MAPLANKKTAPDVRAVNSGTSESAVKASPNLLVPFARAAKIHTEPGQTFSTVISASTQLQSHRVPVNGFIRSIHLIVTCTTAGNAAATAFAADGPYSVLRDVYFRDSNGTPITKTNGYEMYLYNVFGGYRPFPFNSSAFNTQVTGAGATGGSFSFVITIPVAFARDGIGALANMDSSQQYSVDLTIGTTSDIYTTAPTNPGTLTTQVLLESFMTPANPDQFGNQVQVEPPGFGTVQYWSKQTFTWSGTGEQTVMLGRVGNYIRNTFLIFRDGAGTRSNAVMPTTIITEWDNYQLFNEPVQFRRIDNYAKYGVDAPTGVLIYNRTGDPEGLPVGEYGDQYLPTLGSTKLLLRFTPGAVGQLDVLTNDVFPVGNIFNAMIDPRQA